MADRKQNKTDQRRPFLGWGMAEKAARLIERRGLDIDHEVAKASGKKPAKKPDAKKK